MDTLTLLWAALCLLCVKCETLTQPDSVSVQPGQTLNIQCTVSYSVSSYWTAWIRQPAGKGLEWIGSKYTGDSSYKDSLKNKFSIDLDTSSSTVTLRGQNMQPGDTAVYYCAREYGVHYGYFDYWGKGTQVTVTSANPTAPTVFPVMPCNSGTGDLVTLACLATGFSPSAVSFSWTHNGNALNDAIQYPSIEQNNVYSGVSQIRIRRADWDQKQSFKCKVDHAAGSQEVNFSKPNVRYELPSLKMMTSEKNEHVTFSCLANDFTPNVFDFQWLQNNEAIRNKSLAFNMPSKATKSAKGSTYSAASFLTLPTENLEDSTKFTCQFKLGRGEKEQLENVTEEYRPSQKCSGAGSQFEGNMIITPPSEEDMLFYRSGKLRCEVNAGKDANKVVRVAWMDERGNELMNNSDTHNGAEVRGSRFILDLEITYSEWNSGIKRECQLDHKYLLDPLKKIYERKNEKPVLTPSVFMLAPLKQTKDDKVTLTCYIKNFYPKEIYVKWQIDDNLSPHEFNTTNSMQTNGSYYTYSHLTIPLSEWEQSEKVYSCLIYHESIWPDTHIVRSITQNLSQQTTMVNLNMKFPDMCKAQ